MAIHRSIETRQRQTHTNAVRDLTARAANKAKESGEPFEPPTKDQIKAECQRRWQVSLEFKKPKKDVSEFF